MDKKDVFMVWPRNWSFVEGTPEAGWETERRAGCAFDLDGCQNLDKICKATPQAGAEGVIYADLTAGKTGTAMMGIGCNWCFEAYCDGVQIYSTYDRGNGQSYVFATNNRVFFPVTEGQHLLAIRVKRGDDQWNFACGWAPVEPPAEPQLTYGPWLTNPDAGRVTVAFCCSAPLGAGIEYRRRGETAWQMAWHHRQGQIQRRTYHAVPLTGLEPGAVYEYRIAVIHPDTYMQTYLGGCHEFTAPDAAKSSYSFFFTADLQFSLTKQHEIFGKMLEAAKADECDFFVLDGDVNSAFLPEDVIRGPFAQLCEHGADGKPIIYVRGNHELRGDAGDRFLDYFATNIGTTYDVLRLGDTAFLLLDSWEDKPAKTPGHTYCQWNMDDWFVAAETAWLKEAMADPKWTGAKRRIVICHGAGYSHFDGCLTMPYVLADMTDPYFEGQQPASLLNFWFAGHVHRYMRSVPGTDEIVAEAQPPQPFKGGKTYRYPVLTVGGPSRQVIQASCFRVDADADGFRVRAWDEKGRLLEDLRYDNECGCTETQSIMKHYTVEPKPLPPSVRW